MFKYLCVILSLVILEVSSHGMMMDPINRSSRWRENSTAPPNYDDNENFCGGFGIQWGVNEGKCGVCGDDYRDPHPQENENTGTYGNGVIVKEYAAGEVIDVTVDLNTNHKGHFEFHLCELLDSTKPESGEECFQTLQFEDGTTEYKIEVGMKIVKNRVKLPEGYSCNHCVLRWHYRAGNNWGQCDDGTEGDGCGPQEHFRSCSDIRIV